MDFQCVCRVKTRVQQTVELVTNRVRLNTSKPWAKNGTKNASIVLDARKDLEQRASLKMKESCGILSAIQRPSNKI